MTTENEKTLPKLLLDSNVSKDIFKKNAHQNGLDAIHVQNVWPPQKKDGGRECHDPGDALILRAAYLQNRVVLTRDNDFIKLTMGQKRPNKGVLLMLGDLSAQNLYDEAMLVLETYGTDLNEGRVAIYESPNSSHCFDKFHKEMTKKHAYYEETENQSIQLSNGGKVRIFKTPYLSKELSKKRPQPKNRQRNTAKLTP